MLDLNSVGLNSVSTFCVQNTSALCQTRIGFFDLKINAHMFYSQSDITDIIVLAGDVFPCCISISLRSIQNSNSRFYLRRNLGGNSLSFRFFEKSQIERPQVHICLNEAFKKSKSV